MLEIVPITLKEANTFIEEHHRHHKKVIGHKFSIGCSNGVDIVGVAIIGRPVSRHLDDGWTLEITRCCSNGSKNVCSKLYGAATRASFAMGYKRVITYTLATERGTSLKASGFRCLGKAGGGTWSRKSRPRIDTHPIQKKIKWARP